MELKYWNDSQIIPLEMELLNRLLEEHQSSKPLRGITVLAIQHQLGNHVPQTLALFKLGIEPEQLYWLDIPYTEHDEVRKLLLKEGKIKFSEPAYKALTAYAPYQRTRLQEILRTFFKNPPERLLVLDDGAYYLEAISCFKKRLPEVYVVEQTTRGFIKIEENAMLKKASLEIPIVDVATSKIKKKLEPKFIAKSVCDALCRKVEEKRNLDSCNECLILGYGSIGRQVAEFVNESLGFPKSKIIVFDKKEENQILAKSHDFQEWDRQEIKQRFSLVLGCSGRASFTVGDHVYLKDGAILASASSGSVELSRKDFIELAHSCEFDDIKIITDGLDENKVHSEIKIQLVDKTVTFINAGFPVNFDGRINNIPAHYIQPTQTMMIAGAIQAVNSRQRGTIPLDEKRCMWIDKNFRDILGEESKYLPQIYEY